MTAISLTSISAKAKNFPLLNHIGRREAKLAESVVAYAMPLGSVASTAVQAALSVGPFHTDAGDTGEVRFLELAANGVNYVGFKAPDSISANKIWTLPSADGSSGQALITNGSGVLSFSTFAAASSLTSTTQAAAAIGPFHTDAGDTGEVRFLELAANGTNYVGFKAPDSISANLIYVLPAAAPAVSGRPLVSSDAGVLSFAAQHIIAAATTAGMTGGAASEDITIAGVAATDVVVAVLHTIAGSATFIKTAVAATGKITVTADANFNAGDKVSYIVVRP